MKALIFGVGGFVGSYLTKELQTAGYVVHGSDLHAKQVGSIPVVAADLLNAEVVVSVVQQIRPDVIINLAAISSVGQSWSMPQVTMQVNVIGALNILEAARKLTQTPKILFIGSSEEYVISDKPMDETTPLNANNPYGISKLTQERFAALYREQYGMKIYCVRPFNHTGVGQRDSFVLPSFCKQVAAIAKTGKPGVIKVGNLTVKRDFSHVKDIVRAYRMILESEDDTKIYNVGSGKAYALEELLAYIIGLSHQNITVTVDADRVRPTDNTVICCDYGKIANELGWKPKYTVYTALNEMYESYLMEKTE